MYRSCRSSCALFIFGRFLLLDISRFSYADLTSVVAYSLVGYMHPCVACFVDKLVKRKFHLYNHAACVRFSNLLPVSMSAASPVRCWLFQTPPTARLRFFVPVPAADVDWLAINSRKGSTRRQGQSNCPLLRGWHRSISSSLWQCRSLINSDMVKYFMP